MRSCLIGNVVNKQIAQRQAASRYLKELVAIGVLQEIQVGKEKLFIHPKLMQLLIRDSNAFKPYVQAGVAKDTSAKQGMPRP
jgi:hypothetical protein